MEYLLSSYNTHPLMRVQDFVKQLYQCEHGNEPSVSADAVQITKELAKYNERLQKAQQIEAAPQQLFDRISSLFVRLNVAPFFEKGFSAALLPELAKKAKKSVDPQHFCSRLDEFLNFVESSRICLPYSEAKKFVANYKMADMPELRHSASYRYNYFPFYRIVNYNHAVLLPILTKIDYLLNHRLNVTVAIDGNCCAGKTYFAEVIRDFYDGICTVVHCDDFFLPGGAAEVAKQMQQKQFGNLNYPVLKQVLEKITKGEPFTYQKFNCQTQSYVNASLVPRRLTVLEGSYSLAPPLKNYVDTGLLLTVNANEQKLRLLQREGAKGIKQFSDVWIPLENSYLANLDITTFTTIDTSDFFRS